ncbi:hypothetical protein ANN_21798 [Periplaneta americana]|uniref:RNase H type-1 domain-containing protein n=1 Tax=Periplaneta americana TaxID=6978 RepID=A0ABQ8S6E9_PERAM|nr:hypothetical protein ANN_21798 [Periplaneta americana]
MATVFWDRKGVLLLDFMPKGTTINADRYCETLRKLRRAIQNKRRGMLSRGVVLLHDNARPYTAASTRELLDQFCWEVFDHPPYSPDLAPSNFHLFTKLKDFLGGTRFGSDEELKKTVNTWLNELAVEEYNTGILKLVNRYDKCLNLFSWLVSIAEAFLQGHQDMGSVLAMAKDFLELHHQLLNDLQKKGIEINAVLLTLPPILEFLDDEQREDVDQKVDALHSHWLNLKSMLETRIDLADIYVKFHTLAVQLANEFDSAEEEFRKTSDGISEDTIRLVEQKWLSIQQLYEQLKNVGKNFIEDASKVGDPYLDIKRASLCVETLLEHFGGRQLLISESWQTWQSNITVEREFKVQWEMNVTESTRVSGLCRGNVGVGAVFKTVDWVSKLDEQLYPVLTSDTKSSKAIARELEEKLQIVLPEVKRAQTEVELRIKTAETLAQKGDTHGQKEAIVESLMELHNKLQVIITDYQVLLQMLISFFKNLAELEKTIENLQSQYQMTRLPSAVAEVELLLKEHEASRQAVLELFKFTQNESEQIIARIRQQEPELAAQHDIERVTILLEEKRLVWDVAWTERKIQLEQHQQLCHFDSDLHQINSSLSDLSTQLSAIRGQYGESLASAKATSLAFVYFEKTIEVFSRNYARKDDDDKDDEPASNNLMSFDDAVTALETLLELRIKTFVSTAEQMLSSEHVSSSHIERELKLLQSRWTAFHNQVVESRRLIDLSIEYFRLVEEAEEWFREGSKLLLTIARKSTTVKLPEEATHLLNEVEFFLKPGETRQDERIRQISRLAIELYGEERSKQVTLVLNENKEMMDSFTVISLELSTLAKNLKAAEEERERQKKEQEEVDASLAAARAEAAAAKAAASAADEARKAAEAAAKALQEAAPFLQTPVLTYCGEILITSPFINDIEYVQNQALRLITGGIKTTPIDSMRFLTNINSIKMTIEEKALIQYEKLIRLPGNNWHSYSPLCRLKTQSFISIVQELKQKINIPNLKENLQTKPNPLTLLNIEYNLNLTEEILKSEVNTKILKQLSLETINIRYPPQNWLHLYTDGSLISREQGASASVTCCLFSLYRSLGYGTTSFDGEIIAISECLRNLLCHINKFRNAVILSDSKAAILSIVSKHTPSSQTAEITKMLSQLISLNKRIVFQWIPSHCGILGNENVDALAKKGSTATYRPVTKSTYYSVKRFIKSTYLDFNKQNLITQSQGKKWNSLHQNPQLILDLPRKSSVAAFRLATGHDCLAKHLHRIGIYISPLIAHCATQTKKWIRNTSKSVLQWLVMIISLKNIGVKEVK